MKVIVGLGNPGKVYARSRHNIGFRCLNRLAILNSIRFDHKQCHSRVGRGEIEGEAVVLAKPMTFMNLSGKSVACLVRKYDLTLGGLLVIYDDIDLPLGKIRLRQGGGSGGHRGMNSIISSLGSEDFPRIRVGIGRPQAEGQCFEEGAVVSHVLSGFSAEEEQQIKPVVTRVSEAIHCFVGHGIEAAMNEFN